MIISVHVSTSLLVAIGLEAFNKFAQEESDKLERERTTEEEEEKKRKITGRFLIKGMVDILADTFATTNQWVRRYTGFKHS